MILSGVPIPLAIGASKERTRRHRSSSSFAPATEACARQRDGSPVYLSMTGVFRFHIVHINQLLWWRKRWMGDAAPNLGGCGYTFPTPYISTNTLCIHQHQYQPAHPNGIWAKSQGRKGIAMLGFRGTMMAARGGRLYFFLEDKERGKERWSTDWTEEGMAVMRAHHCQNQHQKWRRGELPIRR